MSGQERGATPTLFTLHGSSTTPEERIRSGMLWSAWADALGFITELTDERGVHRRTRGVPLTHPVEWTRRIGGRQGVRATLPAGCYSDDTQLRLAVSRAITSRGFDVEAFAKIELAVWPSYALGGGRASKAAASRIARPTSAWFSNQFDGWHQAGGNGAAMRVQPHAWAAADRHDLVTDVIRDAVTTHGHPRALVGSVLIAAAIEHAMNTGNTPGIADWPDLLNLTMNAFDVFKYDEHLAGYWVGQWEQATQQSFAQSWHRIIDECHRLLDVATPLVPTLAGATANEVTRNYADLANTLELRDERSRGSGTVTTVAALVLAAAFPRDPMRAALVPALAVGTDTDTIATMAASVVATATPESLPSPVLDQDYLIAEADRLASIRSRLDTSPTFPYPDLLHWTGPRSGLDCVGLVNGKLALAGMGTLEPFESAGTDRHAQWTWVHASWGQTLVVKHRPNPDDLPRGNWPRSGPPRSVPAISGPHPAPETLMHEPTLDEPRSSSETTSAPPTDPAPTPSSDVASRNRPADVDSMLVWVERSKYAPEAIGYAVARISEVGTIEQLVAFTTALRASLRRRAERDPRP